MLGTIHKAVLWVVPSILDELYQAFWLNVIISSWTLALDQKYVILIIIFVSSPLYILIWIYLEIVHQ